VRPAASVRRTVALNESGPLPISTPGGKTASKSGGKVEAKCKRSEPSNSESLFRASV
jgi:hypothetical protein